ncbi:MAG TPA: aminodeoxychorismate synthase component I [Acidobacteriota bacterium]|nr:aminodeoxychorismate synthase component I [Acidobacteriota bacterium]
MTIVLLESLRPNLQEKQTFFVEQPELVLQTNKLSEVKAVLNEVQNYVKEGWTAFGFLTYEAGFAFLPNLPEPRRNYLPLLWFALTKSFQTQLPENYFENTAQPHISDLKLNLSLDSYSDAIQKIKIHIEKGDTYQVNYTMRYTGKYDGPPKNLYAWLRQQQRVNYAAYIETPEWSILSFSPELFFRRSGSDILMRPMKGTAPRGKTPGEDAQNAAVLHSSIKERSENLMIVDLLRNDLGKVCKPGSVHVIAPMEIECYETLLQMTSTVQGTLNEQRDISQILEATFPSGSITGAPKIRTMQIIDALERQPRGIYTGSIGWWSANECVFNVAIRTLSIEGSSGKYEMGVGSGILYEADATREYEECKLKAQFLTMASPPFSLFETILWEPKSGFRNLPFHLERLERSALYFLFKFELTAIQEALASAAKELYSRDASTRVKLLIDETGTAEIQMNEVEPLKTPLFVSLSKSRTNSEDRFLYHKTTLRDLYEAEHTEAKAKGFFDVIFRNERNEITEGAISNVFIEKNGKLFTPPVKCGLLNGTFRRYVLDSRKWDVEERILTIEDLKSADRIYVSNAIRGLLQVQLKNNEPQSSQRMQS